MYEMKPPPYAVVVSLQKSGTNLVSRLMSDAFGYRCIGHGIRDSFDELLSRLHDRVPQESDRRRLFSRTDLLLEVLKEYPPGTCLFLHGLKIEDHLLEWASTKSPPIFYNFRDPRDSLLSLLNYLLSRANESYSPFVRNIVFADILTPMNESERIDFAIDHMGDHVDKFRRNSWLYFHPSVQKLSFESLVGSHGGGSETERERTVLSVADFLGVPSPEMGEDFFDESSRTFYRGQVGTWRDAFSPAQSEAFTRRFGDVLQTYGYPQR